MFAVTEPAPAGSVLRVFVDPDKLVGWIAGQASYAGRVVLFDGHPTTVAVGAAHNAGLLAVRIIAAADSALQEKMIQFQKDLYDQAKAKGATLRKQIS